MYTPVVFIVQRRQSNSRSQNIQRYDPDYSITSIYCGFLVYDQGGYIFYAGASLAGAGYCRQCRRRRRPAILPLQLWQGCQVCVKISAQLLPRVAQFYAC